jgi:hypothetical protein
MKKAITLAALFGGFLFSQETTRTETTTWSGTLVDEGCRTTQTKETSSTEGKTETKTTIVTECPVVTKTTSFGLMTPEGKYVRFDNASNSRIVETIKKNRMWATYITEHKPIKTRIVGTLNGDIVLIKEIEQQE